MYALLLLFVLCTLYCIVCVVLFVGRSDEID